MQNSQMKTEPGSFGDETATGKLNHQEMKIFHHNGLKDYVKHYILKPINLLIL
jgi:hypothetical protein